jgi:hypothetical protein
MRANPLGIFCSKDCIEAFAMRLVGQIALALVAIVGVVAGVTYVSQYRITPRTEKSGPPPPPAPPGQEDVLKFAAPQWKWAGPTDGEVELRTTAYKDFWFENPRPVEVELGVTYVSCKCSGVSTCTLTEEKKKRYQSWAYAGAATETISGFGGFLNEFAWIGVRELGLEMDWQDMKPEQRKSVLVPPSGGGLVRVAWKAKSEKGNELLAVDLWSQAKLDTPTPRVDTRLEIGVRFVPVAQALPWLLVEAAESSKDPSIGDLDIREEKFKEWVCWSSVRAAFSLAVSESTNDPCFECTCTPLSAEECKSLSTRAQAMSIAIRALSGYRIRVTVHERLNDHAQMELGPFSRKILLKSDPDGEESFVRLTGMVRGDIAVGSESDEGRIRLKTFRAAAGTTKVVKVSARQPGIDLRFERIEPPAASFLRVKPLKAVGTSGLHWDLCIEVPPGCPPGKIPDHTAVILTIPGTQPRHVRIPVTGRATQ